MVYLVILFHTKCSIPHVFGGVHIFGGFIPSGTKQVSADVIHEHIYYYAYFRAVSSQNGDKFVTPPPPSIVERVVRASLTEFFHGSFITVAAEPPGRTARIKVFAVGASVVEYAAAEFILCQVRRVLLDTIADRGQGRGTSTMSKPSSLVVRPELLWNHAR